MKTPISRRTHGAFTINLVGYVVRARYIQQLEVSIADRWQCCKAGD